MDIFANINQRLFFNKDSICPGGEDKIEKVIGESPIKLPDDYIEFLKMISGGESNGVVFEVKDEGLDICIWSAKASFIKRDDLDYPFNRDFLERSWMFGDDLGGLVYFYGEGKDGFGLYRVSAGGLCYDDAVKIADSLTDFLVDGVGIDVAITL